MGLPGDAAHFFQAHPLNVGRAVTWARPACQKEGLRRPAGLAQVIRWAGLGQAIVQEKEA